MFFSSHFIFIVGPTAVGKSEFSRFAARKETGEIVNSDSLQFYKGLEIGTAKPSAEEMKQVPHHLFDLVDLGGQFTASDYRREALELFERRRPIHLFFVGGSGFYFQALEKGMYEVPNVPDRIHRELMAEVDLSSLYEELKVKDPETARRVESRDCYRIVRALGVIRASGRTLTEIRNEFEQKKGELPAPVTKIGLTMERRLLRDKVTQRAEQMLEKGLIDETQDLIDRGYGDWFPLRSVGYRECQKFLREKGSRDELLESIITSTMQLTKRQMTWFRRDPDVRWYERGEIEDWSEPLEWVIEALPPFTEGMTDI